MGMEATESRWFDILEMEMELVYFVFFHFLNDSHCFRHFELFLGSLWSQISSLAPELWHLVWILVGCLPIGRDSTLPF